MTNINTNIDTFQNPSGNILESLLDNNRNLAYSMEENSEKNVADFLRNFARSFKVTDENALNYLLQGLNHFGLNGVPPMPKICLILQIMVRKI